MFIKKACPQGGLSVFSPVGILSSISAAIVQGTHRARVRQVLSRVMGLAGTCGGSARLGRGYASVAVPVTWE